MWRSMLILWWATTNTLMNGKHWSVSSPVQICCTYNPGVNCDGLRVCQPAFIDALHCHTQL